MLKILIDTNTLIFLKNKTFYHLSENKLIELAQKHKLEIVNYNNNVDGITDYDIFVTMNFVYINDIVVFSDNYHNKNVVFLEKKDSSNVGRSLLIKHPQVVLYLKDYTNTIMMTPKVSNRSQFYLCYPHEQDINYNNLNTYSLDKIKTCHWNIDQYSCCGKQFLRTRKINTELFEKITSTKTSVETHTESSIKISANSIKSIDVSCCFHLREKQLDGKHRLELFNKLESLKNRFTIVNKYDIPGPEYMNVLKQTKIFVSPYGMGERTASDYFSIYNDCILIKPYSKYIRCDCDFFNTNYYINCKVDFSDLDIVVEEILHNYEMYYEILQRAKQHLLTITPEKHIDKLFNTIASYNIGEKNYNHSFPCIINEEDTLDMIYYTNVSNVLFDLDDLEYINNNNNNVSKELLNILSTVNSNFMILIPNIYSNMKALNHTCLIENDNKMIFYEKYQMRYINKNNLFYNYDKIQYFSSFITKPHYYDELFNINYFRKISNMFYNKRVFVITCTKDCFDSILLDRCTNKTLFEITNNFYENEYDTIISNINEKLNINEYDIVLVMLNKMSPLISSKLSAKIKVIDLGKTFDLLVNCLNMYPDDVL